MGRTRRFRFGFVAALLVASVGCTGDTGPAGPEGPAGSGGSTPDVVINFVGSPPALRADGTSSTELTANVATINGANVVGTKVTFSVYTGAGSVNPTTATTDAAGNAKTIFTAGTTGGMSSVAASVMNGSLTLSGTANVYADPPTVSTAVLNTEFSRPIRPNWSADATTLYFDTDDWRDNSLYKVDAVGGEPEFFGNYRGGAANPDGSTHMAVYNAIDFFVVDATKTLVQGPMQPAGFYGNPRAAGWANDGTTFVAASNTNALLCWSNPDGTNGVCQEFSVWTDMISPVAGTSMVVITGSGESSGGMFRIDLLTSEVVQLVADADWYSVGIDITGFAVNNAGNTIVYAARELVGEGFSEDRDLYTIPVAGGLPTKILDSPMDEIYPGWSPDDLQVIFCSDRPGTGYNLYKLDID